MRLKDYDERDGKRVWLDREEIEAFIDEAETPRQRVAFLLGVRCGLRRSEITSVTPEDFVDQRAGAFVRVWEDYAKRSKYREVPVPAELKTTVETLAYNHPDGEPVVDVADYSVLRWVQRAAQRRHAATDDDGWQFLDAHDLRRTWGVDLLERGVLPSVVMEWGGWASWSVFRKHYLTEFSPEGLRRERNKVGFYGGTDPATDDAADPAAAPVVTTPHAANFSE